MTDRLTRVGRHFRSLFSTVDGREFYGQILSLPDTSRVSNFHSARRYLRVEPGSFIGPGEVVVVDGVQFIVANHGTGFFQTPIYKHFKLFEVDAVSPWYARVEQRNPITDVVSYSYADVPVMVYLSTQPKPQIEDQIKIPVDQIMAVCNRNISLSDKIGEYKVTKVDSELGVPILLMKRL